MDFLAVKSEGKGRPHESCLAPLNTAPNVASDMISVSG